MRIELLQKHKQAQAIAKKTIKFLKSFIKTGVIEKEIKIAAEKFMQQKGAESFWYYNIGAFVFVGKRTTKSISGREYKASDVEIKNNDLVTVDLSPEVKGCWGDLARSFIIEEGEVVDVKKAGSKEMKEGILAEQKLHAKFKDFVKPNITFSQVFKVMNDFIRELGFINLDFNNNLGHSIEENKEDRIYIETGNKKTFQEIDLFTFEPHIKKKNGYYGFKHENIYYFQNNKLKIL